MISFVQIIDEKVEIFISTQARCYKTLYVEILCKLQVWEIRWSVWQRQNNHAIVNHLQELGTNISYTHSRLPPLSISNWQIITSEKVL